LSHNLHLGGYQVSTYHPFLAELQDWFPHLRIKAFPLLEKMGEALSGYSRIFIFYEKSPWMEAIMAHCLEQHPKATLILNPIATPNRDYPYWENGKFDGNLPFADNLLNFCRDSLGLKKSVKTNGVQPPLDAKKRGYPKRIVLHPTSSRPGKNWPQEKYVELSARLKESGFEPVFILTEEEKRTWQKEPIKAPTFSSLSEIARFIYESGYMIGNDSGIGHLASCLGIPTLTICRNALTAKFWRPAWTRGEVLFPPAWVPNIKGLRLRDKHWKKWISVGKVFNRFELLSRIG
jgi:heptosyltransferase-3